jgi:NAD(P)-dependent dehydrogenase (short-subunit alcohol dehydrogenase family)
MSTPKSVLITGCSAGGIGSSLAFSFAKRGFLVFATARTPSKIAPKLSSLSNVEVLTLDTTSKASIAAAAEAVSKRTGGTLDYLFNNSGSGLAAPFLDTDLGMGEKLFEVNVWGVMKCIQGFKELLLKAKGTIVNIASIAGVSPNPYQSTFYSPRFHRTVLMLTR